MNYYNITENIKTLAKTLFPGYIGVGDIYELNHQQNIEYPAFVLTDGQQLGNKTDNDVITYSFNMFLVDRLTEDKSNETDVKSWAIEGIKKILELVEEQHIGIVSSGYTINTFTERFDSLCAGAYVTAQIIVDASACEKYIEFATKDDLKDYNPTTNFKTINGNSIIGRGNIKIEGGGASFNTVYLKSDDVIYNWKFYEDEEFTVELDPATLFEWYDNGELIYCKNTMYGDRFLEPMPFGSEIFLAYKYIGDLSDDGAWYTYYAINRDGFDQFWDSLAFENVMNKCEYADDNWDDKICYPSFNALKEFTADFVTDDKLETINTKIATLNTEVGKKLNKNDFASFQNNEFTELSDQVDENTADIGGLSNALDDVFIDLNNKADKNATVSLTTYNSDKADQHTIDESQNTAISGLENDKLDADTFNDFKNDDFKTLSEDFDGLSSDFSDLYTRVDTIEENKLDKKTYNTFYETEFVAMQGTIDTLDEEKANVRDLGIKDETVASGNTINLDNLTSNTRFIINYMANSIKCTGINIKFEATIMFHTANELSTPFFSLDSGVMWIGEHNIEPNKYYCLNLIDNIAVLGVLEN